MNKIKAVGFLQNPWSPVYAGGTWPRKSWLLALNHSRSGQRLKLMQHPEVEIYYDNANPIVCENPRDIFPADLNHMKTVLQNQHPDMIITFGIPAANGMKQIRAEFSQPWLCLPHPTYRVVTNRLFTTALNHLVNGFDGMLRIMPARNGALMITQYQGV